MANPSGLYPRFKGVTVEGVTLVPNSAQGANNSIVPGVTAVSLAANANGVTDFTVLPPLASVPAGHTITIIAGAANSELRTPASSNEKINNVDSDGTQEALLTATNLHFVTKIGNTTGWMLEARTAIGAFVTAIVPHV